MSARRRLSATARVAAAVALVVGVAVAITALLAWGGVRRSLAVQTDDALAAELEAFAAAVDSPQGDFAALVRDYLSVRPEGAATPIVLVRLANGRVLSNSAVRLEEAPDNAPLLADPAAAHGYLTLDFEEVRYRLVASPVIGADGSTLGVVEAALPLSGNEETARRTGLALLAVGLGVIALGAAASALVARTALTPLARAAGAARGIGRATLSGRLPNDGPDDEVGALVGAVNDMLDRLEAAFGEQRRFTHDASHELRTPLAAIRGHLELASDARLDAVERASSLVVAADEVERMRRLVDDLLELARLESGPPERRQPLDAGLLAQEAAERARALGPQRLVRECADDAWVSGDPDQLMQVLLNLLGNAVEHSPADGEIRVACTTAGRWVEIWVQDDGPGVPQEDLERIFDRFFRGASARGSEGSGLGLAIAKRLVELHGGTIAAESADGGGARFTVRLPRIERPGEGAG